MAVRHVAPSAPGAVEVVSSLIGQTLGHYRVIDQLGAGGMGVVYRAEDLTLGRQVAIKVLPPGSAEDHEAVERFRREARTASSLNHPNICTIYGFDEQGGQLYLAMELLDGEPLDRRLTGRPMDLRTVIDIGAQVADALDAAHAGGVLHRDVKPANIFITRRSQVKVLDFGLAKLAPDYRRSHQHLETGTPAAEHFSSVAGTTVGTIAYMSPEQARGENIDSRTDLFSFGVVLYEMATGRHSFAGQTTAVVFDAILNRDPAPASSVNPAVPPELDRIIAKALEKDPALRYQTAADLGSDLKRLRRDVTSRHTVPLTASSASAVTVPGKDTADTVVLPGGAPAAPPSGSTAADAASGALAPGSGVVGPTGTVVTPPPPAARGPSSVVLPASGSWLVGAGVGVLGIAVIAGGIGAYIATRGSSPPQPAPTSSPVAEAPPAGAPAAATTASGAPPSSALSSTVAPTPAPPAPAAASKPSTPPTTASKAPARPPAKVAPTASTAAAVPAPPPVSKDDEAQQKLEVARAKMANQLNEQALADLRQILLDYPGSRAAAEASFLAAELLEKVGKLEDAMAAHVEFESRFAEDQRVAESKLRRALIMARTKLPQAEVRARDLLNQVVRDYPGSPPAWQALQAKRRIESERRNVREFDPVLKTQVPVVVLTLRQIIEQFPRRPESVVAYSQLALIYTQMDRHAEAVRVLEALVANFPDNNGDVWFRIGEIYERRLRDSARAREAYAKVPPGSTNYAEAQRRLGRKP